MFSSKVDRRPFQCINTSVFIKLCINLHFYHSFFHASYIRDKYKFKLYHFIQNIYIVLRQCLKHYTNTIEWNWIYTHSPSCTCVCLLINLFLYEQELINPLFMIWSFFKDISMQICPGCSCEGRQGHSGGEKNHLHLCWGCRTPGGRHTSITSVFESVEEERAMIHFWSMIHAQSCSKKNGWQITVVTDMG